MFYISIELLEYWRENLAESVLNDVTNQQLAKSMQISREEYVQGKIEHREFLSSFRTESKECLLCPLVFQTNESVYVPFILLPVKITHEGYIQSTGSKPFIRRKYLSPIEEHRSEFTISSIEKVDQFWKRNPFPEKPSWKQSRQIVNEMRQLFDPLAGFGKNPLSQVLLIDVPDSKRDKGALWSIQDFYDNILWQKQANRILKPLACQMLRLESEIEQSTLSDSGSYSLQQWGQMSAEFGLTPSQRKAVQHFLALDEGDCLAIEGPPGTGKTTLLQSVIASLWVKSAFNKAKDAPIILASSMTNLAITNILNMFEQATTAKRMQFPTDRSFDEIESLQGRWLQGVDRLGAFCVAKSRIGDFPDQQLLVRPDRKEKRIISRNWLDFERIDLEQLDCLEKQYLKKSSQYLQRPVHDVKQAKTLLHGRLKQLVLTMRELLKHRLDQQKLERVHQQLQEKYGEGAIDSYLQQVAEREKQAQERYTQIQQTREEWYERLESRSAFEKWLATLPWIGPKVQAKYVQGNQYFIKRRLLDESFTAFTEQSINEQLVQIDAERQTTLNQQQAEKKVVAEYEALHRRVQAQQQMKQGQWDEWGVPSNLNDLENYLDRTYRFAAFWLATHYWEARVIESIRDRLEREDSEERTLPEFYREVAMVTPCLVVTMHSAPNFFRENPGFMHGFADLLIIDEASQALPELAFPAFAMAKKALVVGDTKQLPPIPSIDQKTDDQCLRKSGLAKKVESVDELHIRSHNGSVMQWANRLTKYVDDNGKPFMLREHFRCHSKIATYFNDEFYKGKLQVNTKDRTEYRIANIGDVRLPALAYAHVDGVEEVSGTSRVNHIEAATIALWVKQFFESNPMSTEEMLDTMAILTPFRVQANIIKDYLKKFQLNKLTVGTVHSLQGMQKEVVLFSPTYSDHSTNEFFYDRDAYILNVAASRAKQSFLIFGNLKCFGFGINKASGKLKEKCDDATEMLSLPSTDLVEGILDRSRKLVNAKVVNIHTTNIDTLNAEDSNVLINSTTESVSINHS